MGVNESIMGLVSSLKTAPEFVKLVQAKAAIKKDPNLKRELDTFERMQADLYMGKLTSRDAESRVKELNAKLAALSKIPEIDRYLKALQSFNDVMNNVYKSLSDSLMKDLK